MLILCEKPSVAGDFAKANCDESLITPGNRNIFNSVALEDHHALIPLSPLPDTASVPERHIYELVLRSFFTVCMSDYIFDRGYVREDRKKLCATDKGLFLLKQLRKDGHLRRIADAGETTAWEQQLQENPAAFKQSVIVNYGPKEPRVRRIRSGSPAKMIHLSGQ